MDDTARHSDAREGGPSGVGPGGGPSGLTPDVKRAHLERLAAWRREKYAAPELRRLFIEVTSACNERCLHCGSRCEPGASPEVPTELLLRVLRGVRDETAATRLPMLCITGGEPLLRGDFFELMDAASRLGYGWGMTTNGTLITPGAARRLAECGMRTASVSIDGLPATHDWFRSREGSFDAAWRGTEALLAEGSFSHIQVTTVVHRRNIDELEDLFARLDTLPLDSWRLTAIEPIGRALEHPELMLRPGDMRRMLGLVRSLREEGAPVRYGCCHYLGLEFEREVRDAYFLCNAGIYIASIMANGNIGSCLDIERCGETVFGNVYRDDFMEVWRNGFASLRREPAELDPRCDGCADRPFCAGGSWHSIDFATHRQRVCLKDALGF